MMARHKSNRVVKRIDFERLASDLLKLPQAELNLTHLFAPGVYLRMIKVPPGTLILGHEHKTEYFNIVLSGEASVLMNGKIEDVKAPCIIKSGVGIQKLAYVTKEMIWVTVHPTDETDIEKIEEQLIVKSAALEKHNGLNRLVDHVEERNLCQQQ